MKSTCIRDVDHTVMWIKQSRLVTFQFRKLLFTTKEPVLDLQVVYSSEQVTRGQALVIKTKWPQNAES